MELIQVAELCHWFAELAEVDPKAAVFTGRKLARWMRAQATRAA